MAFPWLPISILASTLLPMLFGGKGSSGLFGGEQTQRQVTETETPRRGYQSPYLGMLDPTVLRSLLQNFSQFSGFGMPGGGGAGGDFSWIQDILRMLEADMPRILESYRAGGMGNMGNILTPGMRTYTRGTPEPYTGKITPGSLGG